MYELPSYGRSHHKKGAVEGTAPAGDLFKKSIACGGKSTSRQRQAPPGPKSRVREPVRLQRQNRRPGPPKPSQPLSLIHISEPTRLGMISYAVFCLKKK